MKITAAGLSSLPERLLALVLLVWALPALLFVGILLRSTSDQPVLLLDVVNARGTTAQCYRFRTTGAGGAAFHAIGRWIRAFSLDEFPGLWSVIRGDLRLGQLLQFRRLL